MPDIIYFDNAASTQMHPVVLTAMLPYMQFQYANPSSIYSIAQDNRKAIEEARKQVADAINASPFEIYFTSGGTESNNWAIRGIMDKFSNGHIVTSAIEHHAVLNICCYLESKGIRVSYVPVNSEGIISPNDIESAIRSNTKLITIMTANNEIGTIQPILEIGMIAKKHKIPFHTDAVAAVGQMRIDVKKMDVDMLSLSSHKIYGPKGVGALYVRKDINVIPLIHGGAQEFGYRAGTENVAGIVGLGEAAKHIPNKHNHADFNYSDLKTIRLRNIILDNLLSDSIRLNGSSDNRLPGNINVCIDGVDGESLLLYLNMKGICISTGSACATGSREPSHVLKAIGLNDKQASNSIRITLGYYNTEFNVDILLRELTVGIKRLRM